MKRHLRAIDMFCGAGGSSWGARQAGADIIAAFDMWDVAGLHHRANFPRTTFHLGRLEDVDIRSVAAELGRIDLILASPECTNHSPAKGNKPRCELSKDTAFQVTRFAEEMKPRWIVVENVVSMRRWARYEEFKATLRSLGYQVREQVLDSADFSVPQKRRRLFLLCDLRRLPEPTHSGSQLQTHAESVLDLNGRYNWSPLRSPRRAAATLERAQRGIDSVGEESPFLLVYYGSDHAGGWQELSRPLRTVTTLDRFAVVKPSPDGHVMRMLQVPELQLAMGMGGMRFDHGTRRDKIRMLGNAVCPPVMRAVVEQLKAT